MMFLEMLMSLIIFLVVLQVLKFFIIRTFIGKSIILIFKIIKGFCKYTYLSIRKTYIVLNKKINKLEKQQNRKSSKKEVKNKKVVNFNSYRNNKSN